MTQRRNNGQPTQRRHGVVLGVEPRNRQEVNRGLARDPRKVVKKQSTNAAKRARQSGRY